jgi:hypothetical protein
VSDLKPHRRWPWLTWVPAVVLSLAILGAVLIALVYVPQFANGPPPPEPGQVDDRNFSVFTDDGLAFIERERAPRINLADPPVDAAALGLPEDGALTIGPHPQNLFYRLALLVPGEQAQGVRFSTDTFTLVTEGGALTRIEVQPASFDSWAGGYRDVQGFVAQRGARYGFVAPSQQELLDLVLEAQETGTDGVIVTEAGTAMGVPIAAEIVCGGNATCFATFIVTPPVG